MRFGRNPTLQPERPVGVNATDDGAPRDCTARLSSSAACPTCVGGHRLLNCAEEKLETYRKFKRKKNKGIKTNLRNGDYIYLDDKTKGVYLDGGFVADFSDSDAESLYDEWKNVLLRESLALSFFNIYNNNS